MPQAVKHDLNIKSELPDMSVPPPDSSLEDGEITEEETLVAPVPSPIPTTPVISETSSTVLRPIAPGSTQKPCKSNPIQMPHL
jgi:hypothetical protein